MVQNIQRGRGDIIRRREHVIGTCEATRGDLRVKEVLKGTGQGLVQMKRRQRKRNRRKAN